MTATVKPIDVAQRKLAMIAGTIEVLPERVRAEWNDVLNDSARDMAIGWRVHRAAVNARPIGSVIFTSGFSSQGGRLRRRC